MGDRKRESEEIFAARLARERLFSSGCADSSSSSLPENLAVRLAGDSGDRWRKLEPWLRGALAKWALTGCFFGGDLRDADQGA